MDRKALDKLAARLVDDVIERAFAARVVLPGSPGGEAMPCYKSKSQFYRVAYIREFVMPKARHKLAIRHHVVSELSKQLAGAVTAQATPVTRRVCADEACGKPITEARADAVYCSNACRQRAYRRRVAPHVRRRGGRTG